MAKLRYPATLRRLHWLVGLLVIGMLCVGTVMAELEDSPFKFSIYPWHKSVGLLVLILALGFIAARLRLGRQIPAAPAGLAPWERKLAWLTQRLMYLMILVMPLSGYVMAATYPKGQGVAFFGLPLPELLDKSAELSELAHEVHEYSSWLLTLLVLLHIAGALKHRYFDAKDKDVLGRML